MDNEAISPNEISKEDIRKTRSMIDATENLLKTSNPRLFESVKDKTEWVYLEGNGQTNKMLLTEFLHRYGMTANDLKYYASRPKALFDYIKHGNTGLENNLIECLKIPSSGIFYTK